METRELILNYLKKNTNSSSKEILEGLNSVVSYSTVKRCLSKLLSKTSILPFQFAEYYNFILSKSPNLSKTESLAIYTTEGDVPEYYCRKRHFPTIEYDWLLSKPE